MFDNVASATNSFAKELAGQARCYLDSRQLHQVGIVIGYDAHPHESFWRTSQYRPMASTATSSQPEGYDFGPPGKLLAEHRTDARDGHALIELLGRIRSARRAVQGDDAEVAVENG